MSIQSNIASFQHGAGPSLDDKFPDPPDDSELDSIIAPNELYEFDVDQVDGIHQLRQRIRDAFYSDSPIEDWSHILGDHLSYGNKKISDSVAIFNFGTAHDCVNLGTDYCQVDKEDCYAYRGEKAYPQPIHYRRRQNIIWTHLDAVTWARAYRLHYQRKRNEVTALRLNESGDFRSRHELLKIEEIGRRLQDIVDTYTYSASSWLPWDEVSTVAINQSNDRRDYGTGRFVVVDDVDEIPDGDNSIRCPHDLSEGEIRCGDCRLCINHSEGSPTVYVKNFYADGDDSDVTHTGNTDEGVRKSASADRYQKQLERFTAGEWVVNTVEIENNTTEACTTDIIDGSLSHKTDSLIQAIPCSPTDSNLYSANRVRLKDEQRGETVYVAVDADWLAGSTNIISKLEEASTHPFKDASQLATFAQADGAPSTLDDCYTLETVAETVIALYAAAQRVSENTHSQASLTVF